MFRPIFESEGCWEWSRPESTELRCAGRCAQLLETSGPKQTGSQLGQQQARLEASGTHAGSVTLGPVRWRSAC